ncbi:urease accessory protein UreD [Paenibacillus gallinarum]|uniref:Urease accessory protein UreD n=1 Tax=Paenibacillus gallinarum TaxID=2762232 RepID=A0ABR8SXT2_9BACL|nr:urease accessory protein UreD [Paenibacillus gallinarum]MBD7968313.1 urease accessory protein UreD [Paenibacillus gallinarum]
MEDWTGILRLDAEERHGKTVAKNVYFQGAFKVMRPIYHDQSGQPCYYILNPGGGYLDGDRYQMKVSLAEQARMTLTTQSATKIYKTPNTPAYQETEFILKKGSYLEYITDPLIGYQDAKYVQKTVVRMEKGSTFLYSDIITSGWSPEGAQFSYDLLQLMTEVYIDDELALYDHIKLNPSSQNIASLGYMEGFTHLGSMMLIGDQADNELLDRLYHAIHEDTKEYNIGLSLLPVTGILIRILANSTQTIERIQTECHRVISQELFNSSPSFLRKY